MLITIFNSTHESPDRAPAHTHQSKLSIPDLPPLKLIPAQTQANTTPPTTHESPELYGLTGGANTAAVFALVLAVPAALAILKLRPDSQHQKQTPQPPKQRKESKRPATPTAAVFALDP